MTTLTPLMASFNGGEWAPELWGRSDIAKYVNAAKKQSNFISLPEGPLKPRPGTFYVSPTKNNLTARLLPFQFSLTQAYIIECTNLLFRFYKDNGIIETVPGSPYELVSPYLEATLPNIKYAQSNDVIYLVNPAVKPQKLTRTGHTSWTIAPIDFQDGPYLDINVTATTFTPAATTGTGINLTASTATFAATDVGRHVRIKQGTTWGWAIITAFTSTTVVVITIKSDFASTAASKNWRMGAWSDTLGWPSVVIFYERRLFLGNSATLPQTLWGSESDNFESMAPSKTTDTIVDSSAITYTIDDNQVHNIQWLSSSEKLTIGTSSGEFAAQASTLNEGLTPTNITIRNKSRIGSANVSPVLIEQSTIFVQTAGRSIYEFVFDDINSPVNSTEVSIFSKHMLRGFVREISYQKKPWNLIWGCCQDGSLFAVTFLKEQEVLAFHRHPIGGTNAKVLSIATIPNPGSNQVWLVVERLINGSVKRYVEYITDEYVPEDKDDKDGFVYTDSSLEYFGAPVTKITRLDHIIGEEVQILANGASHPNRIVASDGSVTLNRPTTIAQVGLKNESEFIPLNFEPIGQFGSTLQQKKTIDRLAIQLSSSLGGVLGDESDQYDIAYRSPSMPMDQSPPLFTGKIIQKMPNGWDDTQSIVIKRTQPFPLNILAISPRISIVEEPTV